MKRKKTIVRPDGSKEIFEEHDEAPQMHSAREKMKQLAAKGNKGDTQLAHVNNYEALLLKKLGGAGTVNPRTGLRQFYIDPATGLENGLPTPTGGQGDWGNFVEQTPPQGSPSTAPPWGYDPALSQPNTTNTTPGTVDLPMNLAPYSTSQTTSGGTNISNATGINQASNESLNTSLSTGQTGAQNTSNQQATNQATNAAQNTASNTAQNMALSQAQNTASNTAQNTALNQAQNTASNTAQNTNLSQAQNTSLSGAQNTASNTGVTMGEQSSFNTGTQGSQNLATNNSFTNSINYSGLDPEARQMLSSTIMPQLQKVAISMPEQYDIYTQEALGSYQTMMNNALKQNIPQTIQNLASRGIISSTEGQKMLSQVMSNAAIAASTKGYETAMASALAKATNVPDILAKLAQLGMYTSGGSTGASTGLSTGSSFGNTMGTSSGSNYGLTSGTAQGTSFGEGQGTSFGYGQGTSSGTSQGTSLGTSQGTSSGTSQGTSLGTSQGTSSGTSQGTSVGQSTGQSTAAAQGTSYGNQLSQSLGTSSGQSTGITESNALGTNFANSNAYSTDPTVMYREMADLLKGMI